MSFKNWFNAPLMKIKLVFCLQVILSAGYLSTTENTAISTSFLSYNVIFLAALVWVVEGADKIKVLGHAQLTNIVALVCDILLLLFLPFSDRNYSNKGWNIAFTFLIMCTRPLSMYFLYSEAKNWLNSSPVIITPAINTISTGNYENNLKNFNTDNHFVDSTKPKTDASV